MLWATGMRIGEALALDRGDVDLVHGVLTVREAKFGKSRELPVHETTIGRASMPTRSAETGCAPTSATPAFFVSAAGTRVRY